MSFERILQTIVDECGGGFGAALMGLDGVAIAQVEATSPPPHDPLDGDVTTAGIEFGRILSDVTKVSDSLATGQMREAVISLDRVNLVFHTIDEDLVLVLALTPDGNLGKARYLIRRYAVDVRAEL